MLHRIHHTLSIIIRMKAMVLVFAVFTTLAQGFPLKEIADVHERQLEKPTPAVTVVSPYNDIHWDEVVLKKAIKHVGHPHKWNWNPSSSDVIKEMVRYGYKVFGLSMDYGKYSEPKMVWPWTELSKRTNPDDPSEDLDPSELGVVAYPEIEHNSPARDGIGNTHITIMFGDDVHVPGRYKKLEELQKMHPYDQILYYEKEMNSLTSLSHPCRWNHGKDFYIPYFDKTENLVGLSVLSKDSDRNRQTSLLLWDELLEHYADEEHIRRFVWGLAIDDATVFEIGFRTPGRHITMHQGIFNNWMSQIWYREEWNPVEQQTQSRKRARQKYVDGIFFIHQAPYWAHTNQEPENIPGVPVISKITVGQNSITIEADDYEEIRWISKGEIVSRNAAYVFSEDDIGSYVRAELETRAGGKTLTQPFYFVKKK